MKTNQLNPSPGRLAVSLGLALSLACISPALSDDANATPKPAQAKLKQMSGTVAHVDQTGKTVTVESFWSTRTFSMSDNCKISVEDKPRATLADLQPGQQIRVRYERPQGVGIAHEVRQENRVYHGQIEAINAANRTIGVKRGVGTRTFTLPENFAVLVKDDKPGRLEDLKIGQTVDVIFEPQAQDSNDSSRYLALRIEQKNPTFVGTIRSIDATSRTVRAKNFFDEKQFRLADGCRIVTADNSDAALRDLRIGDRVEFVYEEKAGVLIANRIGHDSPPAAAVGSETAKADTQVP